MSWPQVFAGSLLVVTLVAVAGFFLGRQVQTSRDLQRSPPETEDEQRYLRGQNFRRLISSSLLLLLGFLLATALLYLEGPAQELADQQTAREAQGLNIDLNDAQRDFSRWYAGFWVSFLFILMVIVFLTAFDLWATRRHALLEHRKIQADRRAMLEQQITRYRHERNDYDE